MHSKTEIIIRKTMSKKDLLKTEKDVEKNDSLIPGNNDLYVFSRELIVNARKQAYHIANFVMVEAYWKIGQKIV